MNWGDIIILAVVLILVGLSLRKIITNKKNCKGCSGCPYCNSCPSVKR